MVCSLHRHNKTNQFTAPSVSSGEKRPNMVAGVASSGGPKALGKAAVLHGQELQPSQAQV